MMTSALRARATGGGHQPSSTYLGRGHGHVVELALAALRDGSDEEEGPAVLGESRLFVLRATETGQSPGGPRLVCGGQTGLGARGRFLRNC